jgi:hypothetical protein
MKTYGGVDVYIHVFMTSTLVGGTWSASRPGRFTPMARAHFIHWIGGWVSPRTDLEDVKVKNLAHTATRVLNTRPPIGHI